jgi:hypothetical protein
VTAEPGHLNAITVGLPTFTADGAFVGTVKAVRRGAFQLAVPLQPDYWLTGACVAETTAGHVRLRVEKDQLRECIVEPGPADDLDRGMPVYTVDEAFIGYVKELRGAFVKLDVPGAPDVWLNEACVASVRAGRAVLRVDAGHLDDCKVAEPPTD